MARSMVCRRSFIRLAVAAALAGMCGCTHRGTGPAGAGETSRTLFYFDTVCSIGGMMDEAVLDECDALCDRFEHLFSRTLEGTDVWRINEAKGATTPVDHETAELVRASLQYSAASNGLFDITIGAITRLWDFHEHVVPDEAAIAAALPHVGYERVVVDGDTVTLQDPDAAIDLGGIAKGYVTDRLCDLLRERGVESAYVNLGGNVAVIGAKATGDPWSIGVRDPFDEDSSAVIAKVYSTGGSLVTSGLYERSFESDGRRYWHILDPRTGYPVETSCVSASIYAQASVDGDGYTKPLFMMGTDEALSFVEDKGVEALLVDEDGTIRTSEGSAFEIL